ncbi:hypothetical protein PBOI14_44570 [Pseudomonas sp. Boi14]|nr:hypothetical protein PBOI14_44570 [Pseudomonas sp. Boi14]
MWVADMDFAVADGILQALRQRLEHPLLGYSVARDELREAVVADLWDKYAWRVRPDELIFLPGVEPGFNMALHAFVQPQQKVVLQTPNYRPCAWPLATGAWTRSKCRSSSPSTAPTTPPWTPCARPCKAPARCS